MQIDKYQRDLFTDTVIVNNFEESDVITSRFNAFIFKRPVSTFEVSYSDLQRPDTISFKAYGRVNLWWIIMKFNNIEDIWNDLYVGQLLQIPSILDIDELLLKNRR